MERSRVAPAPPLVASSRFRDLLHAMPRRTLFLLGIAVTLAVAYAMTRDRPPAHPFQLIKHDDDTDLSELSGEEIAAEPIKLYWGQRAISHSLGSEPRQVEVPWRKGITLLDSVVAGGLQRRTVRRYQLMWLSSGQVNLYDLRELTLRSNTDPRLRPGDSVFVYYY